jgi:hypothetical protein
MIPLLVRVPYWLVVQCILALTLYLPTFSLLLFFPQVGLTSRPHQF